MFAIVGTPDAPLIITAWTLLVSFLVALLILGSHYVGFKSGQRKADPSHAESRWSSRGEIIGILGVIVMIIGVVLSLFNPDVRGLFGL
jgi:hypothetical protein